MKSLLSVFLLAGTAIGASASTSAEAFDYPPGSAVGGQNGGSGWSSAWAALNGNGTMVAESGSLTYPGVSSSGGRMHFTGLAATGTTSVTYRSPEAALTNGTYYLRFLAQNLNEGRRYFGLGMFNGGTERALLGQASGFGYWTLNHVDGITNASFTNVLVSTVDSSDIGLLVLKLELRDGFERVTFWVNPDLSRPESAATAIGGSAWFTDQDYGQITRVRIGGGGYSATAGGNPTEHYMDEIAIGPVSPFAPPAVACAPSAGGLTVSWPAEYLGWTLQTNALGLPHASAWGDLPASSTLTSTNLPYDPAYRCEFFRLRSP